jgi:putative NADPH-quinone reductase
MTRRFFGNCLPFQQSACAILAAMPTRAKSIVIIDGHPDDSPQRFLHALANAYADGACAGGHTVKTVAVADLEFPLLRSAEDFEKGQPPEAIRGAQDIIGHADHLLLLFPLWLGSMPAILKGFLEQLLRPGFAYAPAPSGLPKKLLAGKSAHVIVTMGMPGFFYRWYYRAHSLKSLERNILNAVGIKPVRTTVIGMVGSNNSSNRRRWLRKMSDLGKRAG